jgi:PAS domain S-box-containing protein
MRPRRRVDGATLLVVLALLLPLLLFGALALVTWRNVWLDATAAVEQAAATVAEYGQRELTLHAVAAGRIDALLRGLPDEQIRAQDTGLRAALQALVDEIPGVGGGYVLDRDGGVLVSTGSAPAAQPIGPGADRDTVLWLAAADAQRIHVSRVHGASPDGTLFFVVSRRRTGTGNPDVPQGGFDGLVSLSASPALLAAQMRRIRPSTTDAAALIREDGEILARTTGLAAPARASPEVVAAMAGRPERAVLTNRSALDGSEFLVAIRRIEGWPIYAATGRPRSAIVATWWHEVSRELLFGVPATLALVAGALMVGRSQRRLAAAKGDLETRVAARTVELAEREALLQGVLQSARAFAFSLDPATGRTDRSASAAEILGLSPDAAPPDAAAAMARVHAEDQPGLRAALAALAPSAPGFVAEYRWGRPDGRVIWLRTSATGHFAGDGRLIRVTGLVRDVTDEAEARRDQRRSETRLRAAAEGAGLGTYEIDFAGGQAWFDARGAAVAGGILPAGRWIAIGGPDWQALDAAIHPEDRAAYEAAWNGVVSGKDEGWSVETRIRRPDGSWCWDWCHGVVLEREAGSGRPLRLVGILQDVSEPRRLQAELRQGQKLQALGELAGGMAHDFNNVLQAVAGATRMIERAAEDPAVVRRRAGILHAAVDRGSAITGRLLAFARRGEAHREVLAPEPLLAELRDILAATLGARIAVELRAAPGLPPLRADRAQLLTVLLNLATNARDAMPQGGTLTLSAEPVDRAPGQGGPPGLAPGAYLRLSVRDTGAGMDAATLARVTEPFFTTKPPGQGTGLGLSLARQFAEQAGGTLEIVSAPGEGTTVTLWLPQSVALAGAA